MIFTIAAIAITLLAIGLIYFKTHSFKKALLGLLCLFIMLGDCATTIPTGHTGIRVQFGRVKSTGLTEGLQFKMPYEDIVLFDNRNQKYKNEFMAFSSDIQEVKVVCSINYLVPSDKSAFVYQTTGVNFVSVLLEPKALDAVKNCITKYTASNLIKSRVLLSDETEQLLQKEVEGFGIKIVSVNIEDLDFTDAFTNAVEAKQVAEQDKLKAQTVQEQLLMEQTKKSEREIVEAEANAKVKKIQADAIAYTGIKEAERNQSLSKTLTNELIKYYYAQNWDGKMPLYMGASDIMPFMEIKPAQ